MGDGTAIQWTDATWNPVYGCTKVSAGCKNCYAEGVLPRLRLPFNRITLRDDAERLEQPLRWTKPRRVFVNSLSDLFHEDVPNHFIRRVFEVMAAAPQHVFQVLTKRPERAAKLLPDLHAAGVHRSGVHRPGYGSAHLERPWPLPNVWLGTSVEDQRSADERIPQLIATPAARRFLSCEPLLERIDLRRYLGNPLPKPWCVVVPVDGGRPPRGVDWVIVGGESGPKARPMNEGWARQVLKQCTATSTPVFVKQLGRVWAVESSRARGEPWCDDLKGGDPDVWPADLRVREMPEVTR